MIPFIVDQNSASMFLPSGEGRTPAYTFHTIVQVLLFFINACFVPTMTAHLPIPECGEESCGRIVSMILEPVSSARASFNSIVHFAIKVGEKDWLPRRQGRNRGLIHDAISAGAVAMRIPVKFDALIDENPSEWRKVHPAIPVIESKESSINQQESPTNRGDNPIDTFNATILVSLPATSYLSTESPKLFLSSNKLNTAVAILQLGFSIAQGYL
jgi:hypothetical protein